MYKHSGFASGIMTPQDLTVMNSIRPSHARISGALAVTDGETAKPVCGGSHA